MSDLNIARLSNRLRDLFLLRGGPAALPELEDSLVPVKVVEDFRLEDYFLGQESLYGIGKNEPAVVGNVARFALFNPASSERVVILERIAFRTVAAETWQVRLISGTGGLANTTVPRGRDSRQSWDVGSDASARLGSDAAGVVGVGTFLYQFNITPSSSPWVDMPFVITAGFAVEFNTTTVNLSADLNAQWRERVLERSEKKR